MSANSILQFCPTVGADNLMDDATYLAASTRINGNQPGIADDHLINKALRQATLLAAALAQYVADNQGTNVDDTLSAATLRTMLASAMGANYGPTHYFVNAPSGADTITGTVTGLTAYAAGNFFYWIQPANNLTTTPTLNLNGIGAVPIIRPGGNAVAIGELPVSQLAVGFFDGVSVRCWTYVAKSAIQSQAFTRFTSGGTADAITGTPVPTVALVTGVRLTTTPPGANTVTNPTLATNGGSAVVIKKNSGAGLIALAAGDYNSSGPFNFEYDGTQWILLNPVNILTYTGYSALHVVTGTTTLTSADFGKLVLMSGSGYTVTLPSAASGTNGNSIGFLSFGTSITLARAGADVMQMNSSNALTSVAFNDGDSLNLTTNSGTQWEPSGGSLQLIYAAALRFTKTMSANLGSTGTAARVLGTTYTNSGTTERQVEFAASIAAAQVLTLTKAGTITQNIANNTAVTTSYSIYTTIQPGQTYSFAVSGGAATTWFETQ